MGERERDRETETDRQTESETDRKRDEDRQKKEREITSANRYRTIAPSLLRVAPGLTIITIRISTKVRCCHRGAIWESIIIINSLANPVCTRLVCVSKPDFSDVKVRRRRIITCWKTHTWTVEPLHQKMYIRTFAPSEDSDQTAHRAVWSESSLGALWIAKDSRFLHADKEYSDKTAWMPRLIWFFAGHTCQKVRFSGFRLSRRFVVYTMWNAWKGPLCNLRRLIWAFVIRLQNH